MKVYKLEVMVIDHDEIGPEEIKAVLENTRYPNRCIGPDVMKIESRDIGEWEDNHSLNCIGYEQEFKRLFGTKSFNVNQYVKVKLTAKGRDIYYHKNDRLNKEAGRELIKPSNPKEDKEGYFKEQLWEIMSLFGEYMHNGFDNVFETAILIDDKDLKDAK